MVGLLLLVGGAVLHVAVGQSPDYTYDDFDSWSSTSGNGELWDQYEGTSVSNGINRFGNQCDSTRRQSPVHVGWTTEPTRQCEDLHEPLVRQINPELDCRRSSLDFAITPHSLRAYFPLDDTTCEKPTLTLSGRSDPYELLFLEVHARSEHVVEGRRFDAEIQMVHATVSGNIMTVSLLVDASAKQDNIEIEWLLQQWNAVAKAEQAACSRRRTTTTTTAVDGNDNENEQAGEDGQAPLDNNNKKKILEISDYLVAKSLSSDKKKNRDNESKRHRDLQFTPSPCRTDEFGNGCEPLAPRRRMFPYNLWQGIWYYGYGGSLSAPPCTENVQWRILDQPIQISRRQYKLLTSLMTKSRNENCQFDTAVSVTGENFRPIQAEEPFGVFHCTNDDFGYFVYSPDNQ